MDEEQFDLNAWLDAHPDVATLPVHLRPAHTITGWLQRSGLVFRVDAEGNVTRWTLPPR